MIDLTDRRAEGGDGLRGIEIKNAQEIFVLKAVVRLQSAAGHKSVSDADGRRVSELNSDVEIIILFKERIGNDVEHITAVLVPIFIRELCGDMLKLFVNTEASRNIIVALQHSGYSVGVFGSKLPQLDRA
ncbi:hypothetical protein [Mesotoga sp.]|uniref:hypothetical protein n=1 Tax=Mesotoga sp. TaxID=2053577 RepID=UPI00345EE59F